MNKLNQHKKYFNLKRLLLFLGFSSLFILILLTWFLSYKLSCSLPFGACYHPSFEPVLAISLFIYGSITSFELTVDKSMFRRKAIGRLSLIVAISGVTTFLIYHLLYGESPQIAVWREKEKVTPYHAQLGIIFFTNIICVNFLLLFSKLNKLWIRIAAVFLSAAGLLFALFA